MSFPSLSGVGYHDGKNLYYSYMVPNRLDPTGNYFFLEIGGLAGYGTAVSGAFAICFDICGNVWIDLSGGMGVGMGVGADFSFEFTPGDYPGQGSGEQVNISGILPGFAGSVEISVGGDYPTVGTDIGAGFGAASGATSEGTYATSAVDVPSAAIDVATSRGFLSTIISTLGGVGGAISP